MNILPFFLHTCDNFIVSTINVLLIKTKHNNNSNNNNNNNNNVFTRQLRKNI